MRSALVKVLARKSAGGYSKSISCVNYGGEGSLGRLKKLTSSTSIAMEKSCEEADFSYVAIA
jgi:hypothetical protein